jgi:hypothetical protein
VAKVKQRRAGTAAAPDRASQGSSKESGRRSRGSARSDRPAAKPARPRSKAAVPRPAALKRTDQARRSVSTTPKGAGRDKGAAVSGKNGRRGRLASAVERQVRIRELDPFVKCGPSTSVEQLYRVDELIGGTTATHLVFFDRHGWYCEHGPSCPAVADVRKLGV